MMVIPQSTVLHAVKKVLALMEQSIFPVPVKMKKVLPMTSVRSLRQCFLILAVSDLEIPVTIGEYDGAW